MEQPTTTPTALDEELYLDADAFFRRCQPDGLTFDDISLATRYSEVLPRETDLDTLLARDLRLHVPIISSDMDTVTEAPMAIAMALNGGLGIIHYNMPDRQQVKEVARVKNHVHGLIQDPITVQPDQQIGDVLALIAAKGYKFHTFPVVDAQSVLQGLLPGRIVKERYANHKVADAMTPVGQLITLHESELGDDPIATADRFFDANMGIHKLLVVGDGKVLRGLFTLADIERIREEARAEVKPARDRDFSLACGAAVSAPRRADGQVDRDRFLGHVSNLVEEGVDVIAVSTAHGHTRGVGELIRLVRDQFPQLPVIAGNVTTAEGVAFLAEAGADAIKIGQGPGSICTTRVVAGVGIPQMTALYAASRAAQQKGVRIIADGGMAKSGDMVKALTLAHACIVGGLLAGCREAPGKIIEINGKLYKQYRGMASQEAMKAGSAARYGHDAKSVASQKAAAEGIEALKEVSGSVDETLRQLAGGIQAGLGYVGARNLDELRARARYIRMSAAGMKESAPHDIIEVKTTAEG